MFKDNSRLIIFGAIGFALGLIVIIFGFWKMLLLVCFVLLALCLGALLDKGFDFKEFFNKLLKRN